MRTRNTACPAAALLALLALAAASKAAAQPGAREHPCDSAAIRSPERWVEDTVYVTLRPATGAPSLPRPWAQTVLEQIRSHLVLPDPLGLSVYGFGEHTPEDPVGFGTEALSRPGVDLGVMLTLRSDGRLARLALAHRPLSPAQGHVLIQFVLDEIGRPVDGTYRVLRYLDQGFVHAVLATLPSMRFQPARVGGCAVKQLVQIPFNFTLAR